MINKQKLEAPKEYFELSKDEKRKITNKCGPDGFINKIIPNSLLGLDISESCNIHDFMFHHSKTKEDFKRSDKTFLKNLKKEIKTSNFIMEPIRKTFSYFYYYVVRLYSYIHQKRLSNE